MRDKHEPRRGTLDTITLADGRKAVLDIGLLTPRQGLALASAAADLLIRSGRIRDDVALDGPQLLQFMGELGDELAQGREARLIAALDEAHRYIDASDHELKGDCTTREDVLHAARTLRDEADPVPEREARRASRG